MTPLYTYRLGLCPNDPTHAHALRNRYGRCTLCGHSLKK